MCRVRCSFLPTFYWQFSLIETGARTGVAGGTDLIHFYKQRVPIAVTAHALHKLDVPGSIAFPPKFLAAAGPKNGAALGERSEEHTSELQSRGHLVCRLLLEKKKRYLLTR